MHESQLARRPASTEPGLLDLFTGEQLPRIC